MNLIVQTPDEQLAALEKPTIEPVEQIVMNPEDWLVVCGGFEERSLAVLRIMLSRRVPFNVLLIRYEPYIQENKADDILYICQRGHVNLIEMVYNRQEPSGFGDTFLNHVSSCKGRIFVDVSAMSRLLIVQALVALRSLPDGFENCFVTYAQARDYPPSQVEAEAKLEKSESNPTFSIFFLSSGVFEVTLIPELSSFAPAAAQTRLIAFPSLDAHQMIALRAEIQPSRISFIEGIPPNPQNKWRQRVVAAINGLDQIKDVERISTSTLDYRETLDCLLKLYAEHSVRERLLISPTGSKMQTVAVGIFRAFVEDVQIVYPTPLSFLKPDAYTVGVGPIHALPLHPFHLSDSE